MQTSRRTNGLIASPLLNRLGVLPAVVLLFVRHFCFCTVVVFSFCNFTFHCCLIDNLHTSCSSLHNRYKCIQFDHAKEFFFFLLTMPCINNVVHYM